MIDDFRVHLKDSESGLTIDCINVRRVTGYEEGREESAKHATVEELE